MSVFTKAVEKYGAQPIKQTLALIDWYIDILYPSATGKKHVPLGRAPRLTFAKKLLDCVLETYIDIEILQDVLKNIALATNHEEYDVTIMYATSPKVLGYWIAMHPSAGFERVQLTAYQPVDNFY